MPKFFAKTTKHGVPIRIMILQSSIVAISALLITFTSGANVDFAFNVSLAVTTAQYLMVYMIMLIAYIVLKKDTKTITACITCRRILTPVLRLRFWH